MKKYKVISDFWCKSKLNVKINIINEILEIPTGCYFYQNNVMLSALQADFVENKPHIFEEVVEKEFEVSITKDFDRTIGEAYKTIYKGIQITVRQDIKCEHSFTNFVEQKLNKSITRPELEKILHLYEKHRDPYDEYIVLTDIIDNFLNKYFGENND